MLDISKYKRINKGVTGARDKEWVDINGVGWLFKTANKEEHCEHLVEKVAYDVATAIGLPHAESILCVRKGKLGSASKDILFGNTGIALVELKGLVKLDLGFGSTDSKEVYRKHGIPYDVGLVTNTVMRLDPRIVPYFIYTMLFDFMIINRDRHHGNWGVLYNARTGDYGFCPVYDSGSGLYATTSDRKLEKLMRANKLSNYSLQEKSRVGGVDFRQLIDQIMREYPKEFIYFVGMVGKGLMDEVLFKIIRDLGDLASETRKKFMYEMLKANRDELIKRLERMKG